MDDIDREILYWIEYFDYNWVDCGKLIDYIKDHFVRDKNEVVTEYVELMEIKVPDLKILDWDYICKEDNDYIELPSGKFLNIFLLQDASSELEKNGLVRC